MNFKIDTIITFLRSADLNKTHAFYHGFLGLPLALDQGRCRIYETPYGNIGFCSHYESQGSAGLVCFVMDNREDVDGIYHALCEKKEVLFVEVENAPVHKAEFGIYQFYALDPSGNRIEFQCFE